MRTTLVLGLVAFGLLANVVTQMLCHRSIMPQRLVVSLLAGLLAGIGVLMAIIPLVAPLFIDDPQVQTVGYAAGALVIYLSGSFTFLCLVVASETSVRFQIMRGLGAAPNGLTLAELDRSYSNERLLQVRLNRLLAAGTIRLQNGRYYSNSAPLLLIARTFLGARILIFGRRSEFDQP